MKTIRTIALALTALTAAAATPGAADAQLGGALRTVRDRAAAAAGAPGAAATASPAATDAATASGRAASAVLEITPAVLTRLEAALAAERDDREEVARVLDAMPTPATYGQCQLDAIQAPEAMALLERYHAEMERHEHDAQALQALLLRQAEEFAALTERRCGVDPSSPAGVAARRALQARPEEAGARAGGFGIDDREHFGELMVSREYGVLKERVLPFCMAQGEQGENGGARIVVGRDPRAALVYTAGEAEALRARCATLAPALQAVI